MRQHFLALMLLGVITIVVSSDLAARDKKAVAKCLKPFGKLGQTKNSGCATKVCKKNGGGRAGWETCPLPATAEIVQDEVKSLRALVLENQNEIKNNNKLLLELLRWTTTSSSGLKLVFELKEEFTIKKNFLVGTLPHLAKEYQISFEWLINGFGSSWQGIIHFTIGGDKSVYGDRTPGVWLANDNQIGVWSAVEPTGSKLSKFAAKTGKWMTMEISQYMVAENKFEFGFKIDGTSYWTAPNTRAEAFSNVKMFSADNWYSPLNGKIRNFQVRTRND